MKKIFVSVFTLASVVCLAESADLKVKDIKTDDETSIVIKKGKPQGECVDYEVVEGTEEVFGTPQFDKSKAYQSWDAACKEWKSSMKELNKDNKILTLACRQPSGSKEGDQHTYKSMASYRLRVRIRDKN